MSTRDEALTALIDIAENGAYANLRLKNCRRNDAAFALVHTTLEHLYTIDYLLLKYVKRQKRVVRNILRLATAELLYMHEPDYAVIHEAVSLCKTNGKKECAGLVNAVLRRVAADKHLPLPLPDDPLDRLSVRYSYPLWLVRMWVQQLGIDLTETLLRSPVTGMEIRAQYPYTSEELEKALTVPYERGQIDRNCFRLKHGIVLTENPLFQSGSITVQNQGSMAICQALGDPTGRDILDACAAPGGKSAYLYSLACGDVHLTAWELHEHRKQLMDATYARLHVHANTAVKDASVYDEAYADRFDAVLVDAPCSGLGLLRDKADIRYNRKEEDIPALAALQEAILAACCRYVRPGGTLVYATCTISRAENEAQVQKFLEGHKEYCLDKERQLLPTVDGVDGFYYARMIRCS